MPPSPMPETPDRAPRAASERILMLLKMQGPLTAARIGAEFGISGEAARQQLVRLAEAGAVEAWSERRGVGRPSQFWRLSEKGQARFPDTHAALSVDLIETIRRTLGEDVLAGIVEAREARSRAAYSARLASEETLAGKVAALAAIRTEEGYMAGWSREDDGSLLLVENHCPICAAATACQEFCRAELAVFRDVLGPDVTVERIEHIVQGARRCAYRIRPVAEARSGRER